MTRTPKKPAASQPAPQPAPAPRASDLTRFLSARRDWAARDLAAATAALLGNPAEPAHGEPSEILRRISSWAGDMATHKAKVDAYDYAIEVMAGDGTFADRVAKLARKAHGVVRRMAEGRPWEHGSSDQVAKGLELATTKGSGSAWAAISEAADDMIDQMGNATFVDDVTA